MKRYVVEVEGTLGDIRRMYARTYLGALRLARREDCWNPWGPILVTVTRI